MSSSGKAETNAVYNADYQRLRHDARIEICLLSHGGPLPAPWLAPGFVANLVLGGEADVRSRGAAHRVGPGDVVLANPGQLREVTRRHTATATTRSTTVSEAGLRDALRERGGTHTIAFGQPVARGEPLRRALRALHETIDGQASRLTVEIAIEGVFDELFLTMGVASTTRWAVHPAIRRARECIEDRIDEDVGLAELAEVAGLSRAHLVREFRRYVGVPPHQYRIHARIGRSRELLANGGSIAATASATGFFDQAHFARHFRRLVGVTPAEYRRCSRAR